MSEEKGLQTIDQPGLRRHQFHPSWSVLARHHGLRTVEELQDEPMLFSASLEYALEHGGPITRDVVDYLQKYVRVKAEPPLQIVIDTRTHMLMRGMYPAIPGWHCDGLVRPGKYDQPILASYHPRVRHYAVFFANEPKVSRTIYAGYPLWVPVDEQRVWGSVDDYVSAIERSGNFGEARFRDHLREQHEGEILEFDEQTLHRASPCEVPGWRMFFRLSVTREPIRDQIRKQTQVYTTSNNGW